MSDFYNKYPYTDFHELNLDWILERVKKLTEDWAATLEEWNSTEEQWQQLYDYVHDYFDNLNVQTEINNKINAMILDGTFQQIATPIIQAKVAADLPGVVSNQIGNTVADQIGNTVANQIGGAVAEQIDAAVVTPINNWLAANITQPTTPVVDTSLSISGAAADAAVTGDYIDGVANGLNNLSNVIGYPYFQFTNGYHSGNVGDAIGIYNNDSNIQRCKTGLITKTEMPVDTVITATGLLQFRVFFVDAYDVIIGFSSFVTSFTIPSIYNGQSYDHMYIDGKFSDSSNMDVGYASEHISIITPDNLVNHVTTAYRAIYGDGEPVWYSSANCSYSVATNTLSIVIPSEIKGVQHGTSARFTIPAGTYTVPLSGFLWICWNGSAFEGLSFNPQPDFVGKLPVFATYNDNVLWAALPFDNYKFNYARVFRGIVFMFRTKNTVEIQTSVNTKIQVAHTSASVSSKTASLTVNDNGLYYVCVDASGNFYLKGFTMITEDDWIIGQTYAGFCYSDSKFIICNELPIMDLYCRQNIPLYLNNDRLGYTIYPTYFATNTDNVCKFGETYKLIDCQGQVIAIDMGLNTNYEIPIHGTITQNTFALSNEKILMVGDSITNRGWLQRQILTHAPNVTFLGSYTTGTGTGIPDYQCEAVPGQTAKGMIQAGSHINENYANYILYYLNGVVPDIVTIEFGLNESSPDDYYTYIQMLIDMIRQYDIDYSHTTKIYVLIPFNCAMSSVVGKNKYTVSRSRIYSIKQCILNAYKFTDAVLIPTNMIFDDQYDYGWVNNFDYGYNVNASAINDFVHPSESVGFNKLADMIYAYLGI